MDEAARDLQKSRAAQRNADFFREARAAAQAISTALSAAGFDDFPQNGLIVLGAIDMSGGAEGDVAQKLGLTEEAASQMIDTLVQRGYLELRAKSGDHGRAAAAVAKRGRAVLSVALHAVTAARWADFPFRQDDIVISALPKSGTTWTQMICALLVFLTPDLPASLADLSPWMDERSVSRDKVHAQLAAQEHRRFIKTHIALSEIPVSSGATYIVVARHPLDVAVSMHQQPGGRFRLPLREWLLEWIDVEDSPLAHSQTLPGAMRWLSSVWARRSDPSIVLLHYEDLSADLEGEMRRLAARLGIAVPDMTWPGLVKAATFQQMRAAADRLLDAEDAAPFFRRGSSGSGRELLASADLAHYHARVAQLAPPDMLAWLHRDDGPNGGQSPANPDLETAGPTYSAPILDL